jgi:APA family basic amino acid/polyamine antiporter
MVMLGYLLVCPWEAIAIGEIVGYLFPRLNSLKLYRIGGYAVYLAHLAVGLVVTLAITYINYREIAVAARLQTVITYGFLALVALFLTCGVSKGSWQNLSQPFSHSGAVSVLLVLQIMPYYMVGFESIAKCAEEDHPEFRRQDFFRAILAAILIGGVFYISTIALVAYIRPWQSFAWA